MFYYLYFCGFCIGLACLDAARILAVFPSPLISHQMAYRHLTHELASRGHEVVVITSHPAFKEDEAPSNLTEIDVHDISYNTWNNGLDIGASQHRKDKLKLLDFSFNLASKIFYLQLKTEAVQKLLREEANKFDLLILEAVIRSTLVYTHIFKVPIIQISSLGGFNGNYEDFGASTHPTLYPASFKKRFHNLTFWEKLTALPAHYSLETFLWKLNNRETAKAREYFGPELPSLGELANNIDMVMLDIHPLWDGRRPAPLGIIYTGGMHQRPEAELPQNLKSYLDSSSNGVIYISLGTTVRNSLVPFEKLQILVKVLSQLPYDVLWKWDEDELPGRSKNIKISKWLPQSDLLKHPNIRLFVTQGGLQSTEEAITAGVPLIGIPILGDQFLNVENYMINKIGLGLNIDTLTEEQFGTAVNTILSDESYRQNVVRLRQLLSDRPMSPVERAVWWTEHVLRHGGAKYLRSPAANISWAQYLELELVTLILTISLAILGIILFVLNHVCSLVKKKHIKRI